MKLWLAEHHLPQRCLVPVLGVSTASVNGKVNGWMAWQPRDLEVLHERFGLSADFVLGFSPEPTGSETADEGVLF